MKIQDIVVQLETGKELTDEQKQFIIDKWQRKLMVKDKKYGSLRCPNCNDVITYMSAHYCMQCGQRIVAH